MTTILYVFGGIAFVVAVFAGVLWFAVYRPLEKSVKEEDESREYDPQKDFNS